MRSCLESGCPNLVKKGRCSGCSRKHEAARGTRQQRGYDRDHDRTKAEWQHLINSGFIVRCATCKAQVFERDWDLGHNRDRSGYVGPQCIKCNRGHRDPEAP